jgi:hypothetical protein
MFTKEGVEEILSIQARGSKSKPYLVKQVLQVIVRYKLAGGADAEA